MPSLASALLASGIIDRRKKVWNPIGRLWIEVRRRAAAAEAPKAEVKLGETKADEPTSEAPKTDEPNTKEKIHAGDDS